MNTNESTQTKGELAFNDVSPRVHELMQRIDRLPPGTYQVTIVKEDVRAMNWSGVILNVEKIEQFSVSKAGTYRPE